MITSVLLILAVVAGFAVVMTKDMAPAAPQAVEAEAKVSASPSEATKAG